MEYSSSTWFSTPSLDLTNANTLRLFDDAPQTEELVEELNRVNAENKRLSEMLTVVCENYNDLKRQLVDYMSKTSNSSNDINNNNVNKKRKLDSTNIVKNTNNNNNIVESSSSDEEDSYEKPKEETIKAKITRVAVRTEASDSTLILKDGYQWRKYGQKVTRDNPCPRAYFKCSFAPTCPVKKKVQRSLEDQSMLVATYEGEHNHPAPAQQEGAAPSASSRSIALGSVPCNASSVPTVTLDLANTPLSNNQLPKFSSPEFQKLLAEQMASSLTKDPNFTAALAAAITGRFVQQTSSD
uniref:WRKY domain-containing protein n=1 Tax=Chenopodium quinoa TaxID=63459 RepID=A0A803MC03_CHEQI